MLRKSLIISAISIVIIVIFFYTCILVRQRSSIAEQQRVFIAQQQEHIKYLEHLSQQHENRITELHASYQQENNNTLPHRVAYNEVAIGISTKPVRYMDASSVARTWVRYFKTENVVFLTSGPHVDKLVEDKYRLLWNESQVEEKSNTLYGLKQMYEQHQNNQYVKWFMKCSDTEFFYVENLLGALSMLDPDREWSIGRWDYAQGAHSRGFVLSRAAMKKLYDNISSCNSVGEGEDNAVTKCLQNVAPGISILDNLSFDNPAAEAPISIHVATPNDMIIAYYFAYEARIDKRFSL